MFYDSLSGLPNAILFIDRLQQAVAYTMRRHQKMALVYLEIDGYSQINDTYGVPAGNRVINEVAQRLSSCVRRQEDTVGRICGDQFGIILGNIDGPAGVRKVLGNIAMAMEQDISFGDQELTITLSVGASICPQEGKEWSSLLRSASMEMHLAKDAGGDSYFLSGEDIKIECIFAADDSAASGEHPVMSRKFSGRNNDKQLLNSMGLSA